MHYFRSAAIFCAGLLIGGSLSAQEVLLSDTENYYEFLALQGLAERPYLNYRTLSDSKWKIAEGADHPWKDSLKDPVHELSDSVRFRIYGPEFFTSYNSAAPYGQNDGVLWQGKGFNSSISAGARLEAYGLELTLKPTVAYSQNLAFDLVQPAYPEKDSPVDYSGKAADYGYFGVRSIDAPQRFGDDPFFDYSWGDSEIRYTWKNLTAGFGTQLIWLGPAKINPIIHSNNAPPYPKFDIGLRKTSIVLPKLGWDLGDIETRLWWGYLSESDWFDNDSGNDHNMISGLTVAYAPPLIKSLSIGLNRTMLSKWKSNDYFAFLTLLNPSNNISAGQDERDQRFSMSIDYLSIDGNLRLYFEWARNDFSTNNDFTISYPYHSQGYTVGTEKFWNINDFQKSTISFEMTSLESSRDFDFIWPTTFYAHHIITQGYSNGGQWLGAGTGTGGNSQIVTIKVFSRKTAYSLFLQRRNVDNDYQWFKKYDGGIYRIFGFRTDLSVGGHFLYNIGSSMQINTSLVLIDSRNYNYESNIDNIHRYNVYGSLGFVKEL